MDDSPTSERRSQSSSEGRVNNDTAVRSQRNKFFVEIIYFCLTAFVIVTIIIAAVVNISRNNHVDIFISLLSTCIGVILPQPAIRGKSTKPTSVYP